MTTEPLTPTALHFPTGDCGNSLCSWFGLQHDHALIVVVRQAPADTSGLREALTGLRAAVIAMKLAIPPATTLGEPWQPFLSKTGDVNLWLDAADATLAATATERPLDVQRLARAFDKVWREDGWEPTGVSREPREEAERIAAEYARLSPATATPEAEDA